MAFSTAPTTPVFEPFLFTETAEIPAGEWMQGSDSTSNNPSRRVHLDGFHVETGLEPVGRYKRFVWDAQNTGRFGVFGRVKDREKKQGNEGDEILFGRGHEPKLRAMRLFNPCVNDDLSLDDLVDAHIEEIAPELDWLEKAVKRDDLDLGFLNDGIPVTFVSQWDAYAYVAFCNQELVRFRQAMNTRQIDEASLTQADRLLLTGGWFELPTAAQLQRVMAGPEGTFLFGTEDGNPLSMQGRPFPHIGLALERDTGIQWGDKRVRHTFGVLWQRTRDRYDVTSNKRSYDGSVIHNPRGAREDYPELSGGASWRNDGQVHFAAAYRRHGFNPDLRFKYVGLRVVRPSTP